ncbi:radical SAM protein [Megasphaera sp.]|uniref:radical SAM protein n=1 Tax=Megasphaera sp. TaxID=2023260 RepID=UPI003FEDB8FD
MNYSLCVNEIFDSIDGEGKKAGQLATFIRLCGCNLRCSYCDTAYAFNEGRHMDIADIIAQVSYPNVTLTGGEPLCQDIHALLEGLKGHSVNIETNGSMDIEPYFKYDHVWFTVDYKSLSFKKIKEMVHAKMDHQNLNDVFDFNPTAENIAKWICDTVPHCVKVTVQESEGNVATYEL